MSARLEGISPEEIEARRRGLQADLAGARQLAEAAASRAREVAVRGRDDDGPLDDFVAERALAEATVRTLEESIYELGELLPILRNAKIRTAADEAKVLELAELKSDLLGCKRADEVIAEKANELAAAVEARNRLPFRVTNHALAVMVLSEGFGLELPNMPQPETSASRAALDALNRVRQLRLTDDKPLPKSISGLPYSNGYGGTGWTIRQILDRVKATPAADLLQEAGAGAFADERAWEAAKEAVQAKLREQLEDAPSAETPEHGKAGEWLQHQLANGPVPYRTVMELARAASLRMTGMGDSLESAVAALRVVSCVQEGQTTSPVYWHIGRLPDGFEFPRGAIRSARMQAAMRF